jgi:hypothetical protein
MKKILLLTVGIFLMHAASSQERITTNVRRGENVSDLLSNSRYLFPEFQTLTLATQKGVGQVKMNYDMLTNEMVFINSQGDTLALGNPKEVNTINFGKRSFIYTSKGYMEILAEEGDKTLLISRRIKPATVKQYGAYGTKNNTAFNKNISGLLDDAAAGPERLTINHEITYAVTLNYYLQAGKSLRPATEKNFQKLFGKSKEVVNAYVKEQGLDLKNEEDITRLFNFCAKDNK